MIDILRDYEWWRFTGDWKADPELFFLRIPKAASSAMATAFSEIAFTPIHEFSLVHVPEGKLAVAVLRDPIDRFRSAWDMYTTWPKLRTLERFGDINAFVEAGAKEWREPEWGCGYWPSSWWLKSADYARERGAIVIDYRTFNEDIFGITGGRLGRSHPTIQRNTRLTEHSKFILRTYYEDDYKLMEGLWR